MPRRAKIEKENPTPAVDAQAENAPHVTTEATLGAQPGVAAVDDRPQKQGVHSGPRGVAFIDVGEGRRIHLYRNNAMQQVGIRFTAAEGSDPRPSKEDTQFLKDNGFRWRGDEKLWTRQFLTPEDKERLGSMEETDGSEQAKLARSRLRIQVMQEVEQLFVQLANEIRGRNGLEPIHFSVGQSQGRGA